ncbi:hypothetical protein WN944_019300 [Citrus x changshan-huyou]|uniref:Uncharacterized protein n=1 Tax=Citrus x changshan-huyou TaxID=2935761 RepID=A0AAP0LWC6_9ROSI
MEVIESLKQKTEKDDELAEESNDEETNASEGISYSVSNSSKSSGKHHEETIFIGSSHNPLIGLRAKLGAQNTEERVSHSFIAPETFADMAVTSNKLDIPPQTIRPSYDYRSSFSLFVAP